MTIVSEAEFTASVIDHVKKLHPDTTTLGLLHPTETGLIERFNTTFLGIERVLDLWRFASIIVQYADDGELDIVPLETISSHEDKIFGPASPMDLVRWAEAQDGHLSAAGIMRTLSFSCSQSQQGTYRNRVLRKIIIVAEKQRRIWKPKTRFFAYSGVYPVKGQRGIAAISTFRVDNDKSGTLTVVFLPDPENKSGGMVKVAGQFEFH
jgi:hypothetical protein